METREASIRVTNIGRMTRVCGPWVLPPGVPVSVPPDFLQRYGTDAMQYDYSDAIDLLRTRADTGALQIDWISPLSMLEGYGRHAIWLLRGLQARGVELNVRDVGWIPNEFLPADVRAMRSRSHVAAPSRIAVAMTLGYDTKIFDHSSPIRIGITQFETNRLPRRHVENINELDHVIVTSSFGKAVFKNSGVRRPISVMTPGVPAHEFPFRGRQPDGLFKVLMLGSLSGRKNPTGAIRIFQRASRDNPDWRLTIKSRGVKLPNELRAMIRRDARITLVTTEDAPEQLVNYYYAHDCFLWPSKGEGCGLPPLEAMATGMELVCADNSGMHDYLDGDWCYPIRTARTESAEGPDAFASDYVATYGDVGEWWVPDEDHGAHQLERCFNRWIEGRGKGARASLIVNERFTIDHSVDAIIKVLEEYA